MASNSTSIISTESLLTNRAPTVYTPTFSHESSGQGHTASSSQAGSIPDPYLDCYSEEGELGSNSNRLRSSPDGSPRDGNSREWTSIQTERSHGPSAGASNHYRLDILQELSESGDLGVMPLVSSHQPERPTRPGTSGQSNRRPPTTFDELLSRQSEKASTPPVVQTPRSWRQRM
jgi:hypothetical protein